MRSLLILAILAFGAASAAEVYRWTDKDGQVHYSDRPREGAERIEIQEPVTFRAPVSTRRRSAAVDTQPEQPFRYESLEIVSPAQEEVLWNIEGQLAVSMRVEPTLQQGHRLRLSLDGQPVEVRPGRTQAQLSEVARGVHVLQAEVVDASDEILIASQPRTFAVQQTSVLNPNNPVNLPARPR